MGHYEPGERIPYADAAARAEAWASDGYEGVTVAGLAIVAADTARVFLAQRALDETDDPAVQETWEFPGGHLDEGEDPEAAAFREFAEEIMLDLPEGEVVNGWRGGKTADDDHYQGFVYVVPEEFDISGFVPNEEVQSVGWFRKVDITEDLVDNSALRPEIEATMDWTLIWPEENNMTAEPEFDALADSGTPLYFHGVMAPEEAESGDARGFNADAITARPVRLPFSWQKVAIGGHDGSVVTGSIHRMMRMGGMIHYEGTFLDSKEADEFCGLLAHFGKFGVSIDGDKGSIDKTKTDKTGVLWYDAVRASGLTAVAIPAFHEAYVAFGPHPDMPDEDAEEFAVLTASGDLVTFDRGPGWLTNPKETNRIHDYWTKKGEPGYAKIAWGTPGDFRRAKALIGEKIAKNSPAKMKYLNQIIAQWHFDALGYWPGDLDKPGNKTSAEARAERAAAALETPPEEPVWDAVLTASAGSRALPPLDYFSRHPDTDATVIEEPDENGFRRTYGYAGEWGICHIGHGGKCTEVPMDPNGGTYPWFHLGRTKTEDGYVKTGLITYGVQHRGAEEILAQTPTQAHFDDLSHAWAAVVLGEDERGVWFSGVVLPTVDEKWLTAIEASGQVSGEWKFGELRTLLTVNVPGFPVMRSSAAYDEDGNLMALSASALPHPYEICEPPEETCSFTQTTAGVKTDCTNPVSWGVWLSPMESTLFCSEHYKAFENEHSCSEPEPTPAELMAALEQADAEAEFEALKEQFLAEQAV